MSGERGDLRSWVERAWRHGVEAAGRLGSLAAAKLPGAVKGAQRLSQTTLGRLRRGMQTLGERTLPAVSRGVRALADVRRYVVARLPMNVRLDSIKSKIVVFALLATLIPTVITAVIAYANSSRAITGKITEQLQRASTSAAREMDLWFKERVYDVKVFASSYEVTENLDAIRLLGSNPMGGNDMQARLGDYLNAVQERFTDYDELFVLDQAERVVASSAQHVASEVRLPPDWLTTIRSGRPVVGDPQWDEHVGRTLLPVAVPIQAAGARLLGALVAKLNFESVDEILTRFSPEDAGYVYLVTSAGTPVVGDWPDQHDSTAVLAATDALLAREGSVVSYLGAGGDHVVGTLRRVPQLDWAIVAEIPRTHAFAPVARLRNVTVMVVSGLLLGVGAIAYGLGLLIVRPLDRLTAAAAEVARGDLAVDLPVAGGGEVGILTEVFNDMVRRLHEGRQKLDSINEKLRLKNEELGRLSVTDALTGLSNRRHLMELLDQEARRSRRMKRPFGILVVDVDHFKRFNDRYGHLAGDRILTKLATLLKRTMREIDSAARYGGEEFVVLLPETDLAGAVQAGERIRTRLARETISVGEDEVTVTVSIGAAEFPTDGEVADAVLSNADAALYEAKRQGRDRVARTRRPEAGTAKREA
jgi:diguanylate cyclase (GGDEF)-like protein